MNTVFYSFLSNFRQCASKHCTDTAVAVVAGSLFHMSSRIAALRHLRPLCDEQLGSWEVATHLFTSENVFVMISCPLVILLVDL
jgi:hypothetical protein